MELVQQNEGLPMLLPRAFYFFLRHCASWEPQGISWALAMHPPCMSVALKSVGAGPVCSGLKQWNPRVGSRLHFCTDGLNHRHNCLSKMMGPVTAAFPNHRACLPPFCLNHTEPCLCGEMHLGVLSGRSRIFFPHGSPRGTGSPPSPHFPSARW